MLTLMFDDQPWPQEGARYLREHAQQEQLRGTEDFDETPDGVDQLTGQGVHCSSRPRS